MIESIIGRKLYLERVASKWLVFKDGACVHEEKSRKDALKKAKSIQRQMESEEIELECHHLFYHGEE